MPTILNTLGDHIKKRRLELGLYRAQVAGTLGVTKSTITNWEKNRTNPALRLSLKIIEFLRYKSAVPELSTLGEKLLQYRRYRGMIQKGLAKRIGIDPVTLSKLERNRGRCLPRVIEKVSAFLNDHA